VTKSGRVAVLVYGSDVKRFTKHELLQRIRGRVHLSRFLGSRHDPHLRFAHGAVFPRSGFSRRSDETIDQWVNRSGYRVSYARRKSVAPLNRLSAKQSAQSDTVTIHVAVNSVKGLKVVSE
jgi:hypothetical protein